MELSRLDRNRTILGAAASLLLVLSLFFMPWYSVDESTPTRVEGDPSYDADTFICGVNDFDCTGFETFPILRWLLLLAALAPAILGWILIRGHQLSYPPGEMTMVAGFAAMILIAYNGILDKPGAESAEIGVSLSWGYWIALLSTVAIAATGFLRSQASGRRERKAPGTV